MIYNSVTSLIVGEKTMIEAPTWWFPSGAGVSPGFPTVSNHGQPDPTATFSFAEPCFIEPQQNFRVEMLFPRDVPGQVSAPPIQFGWEMLRVRYVFGSRWTAT